MELNDAPGTRKRNCRDSDPVACERVPRSANDAQRLCTVPKGR